METGCEIFFFLLFIFLLMYVIFIGIVCLVEYIMYKKEMKEFWKKYKR